MKKIPNEVFDYVSSIQRIVFFPQQVVLYTKEGIYAYIPVRSSPSVYSDLIEIGFSSFYPLINHDSDSFQLFYLYEEKSSDIISVLEDLYLKSVQSRSFSYVQTSQIYHRLLENNHRQTQFYSSIQDKIEEALYPTRPFYYLLLEMSHIYQLLFIGEFFLEKWYQSHPVEYREVFTLRKLDSYNFNGNKVLDFSSARKDYFVYELANYYRMYFNEENVIHDIKQFFQSFSVTEQEQLLFYALIACVEEFDWDLFDDENNLLSYVLKTHSFLSEKYKEYQERKEEVLEE